MLFSYQYNDGFLGSVIREPQPALNIAHLNLIPTSVVTDEIDDDPLSLIVQQASVPTVQNTFDVTLLIQRIRRIEKEMELYTTQLEEAMWFYKDRISKGEICIEQIKLSIHGYFQQQGLRILKTPSGTAYFRTVTQKQWGDPDALLAWTLANAPSAVRTKYEPDKRLLSEHIKKTGETPDGYSEETNSKIYIK